MKKYRRLSALVEAIQKGEIPNDVVSPGAAARSLGITRQGVHNRLKCGTLEAWSAEGVILISEKSIKQAVKKKRGISDKQGELDVAA